MLTFGLSIFSLLSCVHDGRKVLLQTKIRRCFSLQAVLSMHGENKNMHQNNNNAQKWLLYTSPRSEEVHTVVVAASSRLAISLGVYLVLQSFLTFLLITGKENWLYADEVSYSVKMYSISHDGISCVAQPSTFYYVRGSLKNSICLVQDKY